MVVVVAVTASPPSSARCSGRSCCSDCSGCCPRRCLVSWCCSCCCCCGRSGCCRARKFWFGTLCLERWGSGKKSKVRSRHPSSAPSYDAVHALKPCLPGVFLARAGGRLQALVLGHELGGLDGLLRDVLAVRCRLGLFVVRLLHQWLAGVRRFSGL